MNVVKRIDACITDMQTICNTADDDTVEEIAFHVADELAESRDVAKELLAACKQAVKEHDENGWPKQTHADSCCCGMCLCRAAIAKAEGTPE
jgi:hypothetical protein